MKFFGLIILLGVASFCQGVPNGKVKRSVIDNTLASLVETVRELMINGDEEQGIPVLEPFEYESLDLSYDGDFGTLTGTITNLKTEGLTGFEVATLTFTLSGVRFTYEITWPSLVATGGYSLDGSVLEVIPAYGSGDFDIQLTNLTVSGNVRLSSSGGYLYVRESDTAVALGDFDAKLTGVLDNEDVSSLVSAVATDMVPQILVDFNTQINDMVDEVIVSVINSVVGSMTLSELLAIIRG